MQLSLPSTQNLSHDAGKDAQELRGAIWVPSGSWVPKAVYDFIHRVGGNGHRVIGKKTAKIVPEK